MDIEKLKTKIAALTCPPTHGEFEDGWEACKKAILSRLSSFEITADKRMFAKVGVSDALVPLSAVKKGEMFRLFKFGGDPVDQHVYQATSDAEVVDGEVIIKNVVVA